MPLVWPAVSSAAQLLARFQIGCSTLDPAGPQADMVVGEQEDSGMGDSHPHCGNKICLGRGGPLQKGVTLCRWQHRLSVLWEGVGKEPGDAGRGHFLKRWHLNCTLKTGMIWIGWENG